MDDEADFYLDVHIYPYPNPALTEILKSERLGAVVADYTQKVAAVYIQNIADRPRRGDRHPGLMASNVKAAIMIGGFKNDRVIGEVLVDVEYATSDEYGRHSPTPGQVTTYEGSHDLRGALHAVLPHRP
ncbi:MAG: hypothetical protein A4E20_10835 [Nitrospira sp. SG-bin2]|uniref:hypothetical protein n=1 Tax=Nitrospira cf. moscoviensis SBR1015 TaxID=96242 RepID=UPI000A0C79B3|nr:hypothetical protein [Nitrospira cf. moscoviensis SBR1015]OQW34507.1 MAG: hypothetical protein A4E20_10835 [Nitrospira sp. SG-bin2]